MVAQARQEVVGLVTGSGASHGHERDVGGRFGLLPREVLLRAAGGSACSDEAERRPGGQLRVAEASVVALLRLHVPDRRSERGCGRESGKQLHTHTTSVRERRSNRSSTRLSSGPATRASTTFPAACATLNGTPAARRASNAASVCG